MSLTVVTRQLLAALILLPCDICLFYTFFVFASSYGNTRMLVMVASVAFSIYEYLLQPELLKDKY